MGLIPKETLKAVKIKINKISILQNKFLVQGITIKEFGEKLINYPGKYLIVPEGILIYDKYGKFDYNKSEQKYLKILKEVNPKSFAVCNVSSYKCFTVWEIYNDDPEKSSVKNIEEVLW